MVMRLVIFIVLYNHFKNLGDNMFNKYYISILYILLFQSVIFAEETKPFDCTMPIILRPILLQIRKNTTEEDNKDWRNRKPTRINFEISSLEIKEQDKALFDKIVGLFYDNPVNRFTVYIKDGLPVKLEHTDESGGMHVYRQTIHDTIRKMDFENKDYLDLSRRMALKGMKGECPFMDWKPGKYVADIRASFDGVPKEHIDKGIASGEVTFVGFPFVYKFCLEKGILYNSCGIMRQEDNVVVRIIRLWNNRNLEAVQYYDRKEKQSCFDLFFYEDMGLKMLTEYKDEKMQNVTLWGKQGNENTSLTHSEWQTLGMPNDYDEWKKRATK